MVKNYIEYHLATCPSIFKCPADVLSHLLTVLGNGVDPSVFMPGPGQQFVMDIENYPLVVSTIEYVGECDLDRFCVFSRYMNYLYPDDVKSAFRCAFIYLLDCIEYSTPERVFERKLDRAPNSLNRILRLESEVNDHYAEEHAKWCAVIPSLREQYA